RLSRMRALPLLVAMILAGSILPGCLAQPDSKAPPQSGPEASISLDILYAQAAPAADGVPEVRTETPVRTEIQPTRTTVEEAASVSPVERAAQGRTLYSFRAENLELKMALATFARANNLNIVPDQDVTGQVTLDVRDLPLDRIMTALLEAHDYSWQEQDGLIRIRAAETRRFVIDYLRLSRTGLGQNSATLGSSSGGSSGGGGGAGGGGGGGGGGSAGGGGSSGGGSGGGGSTFGSGSSSINVTADNPVDFWTELTAELSLMLTPTGRSSMAINRTAGIVQVTDRPSALKRVENYLSGVDESVHRQVEIEARLYDVTLNDQFQFGIDWVHIASAYNGSLGFGGATLPVAAGTSQLRDSSIGGLNRFASIGTDASATPGGNQTSLVFENMNTAAAINALKQQGSVEVISTPRIRTLNNQTALIKVGEEVPFFNTTTTIIPGTVAGTSTLLQETIVNSITIGTILSITPQVSDNDWISLDISPVLTTLKSIVLFGGGGEGGGGGGGGGGSSGATAPNLDTKQASTLVRVRDGTTVVIGGLIQTENAVNEKKVPILGDIPLLGKLFTGTFRYNQKKELVIFVTPRIIRENEPSVSTLR
ncbi:MAG TPA: secretin N-terminal domain-containing protein, partial [Methylomirabilota bacterium]|nr:secretin N-terminal domain-containing protein [Methylomirabilota bacterium]